ncbi:hypothetical protein, partial [Clostridium perfringens]
PTSSGSKLANNKGKGVDKSSLPPVIDETARSAIQKLTENLNVAFSQLQAVQTDFANMKARFDAIDSRLNNIENMCAQVIQ